MNYQKFVLVKKKVIKMKPTYYLMPLEVKKPEMGLTGLIVRCQQGCIPPGHTRRESIFLSFPNSMSCPHFLTHGPSLHPRSQQWWVESFSHGITDSPCICLSLIKTLVSYWAHPDNPG